MAQGYRAGLVCIFIKQEGFLRIVKVTNWHQKVYNQGISIDDIMSKEISFKEAVKLAEDIIARFEKIEGRKWGAEGSLIELQKQVGELSKLIMVHEKYYHFGRDKTDKQYESTKEKIADELADILYAIIRIAKHYNIDLEKAHVEARKAEDDFLRLKGN